MVKLIDCPRDAIQGIKNFIPTENKIEYLNALLHVGFDTIDFGSFVSARSIPQLRDTAQVVDQLDLSNTKTKLLAIVANERGAIEACTHKKIKYLGFPFSISPTFQAKNTHMSVEEAFNEIIKIHKHADSNHKKLVVHISMAFGNPYLDDYDFSIVHYWIEKLKNEGIKVVVLSDTVGIGEAETIKNLFEESIREFPTLEFGAHLHSSEKTWYEKIDAAYAGGCRRFDGALRGFGGCPMSGLHLVGNIASENLISYFMEKHDKFHIDLDKLEDIVHRAGNFYNGN